MNIAKIKEVMIVALPDHADFIENNHLLQYYTLVDELENRILLEIDKMLRGEEQTEQSMMLARKIVASAGEPAAPQNNIGADGVIEEQG